MAKASLYTLKEQFQVAREKTQQASKAFIKSKTHENRLAYLAAKSERQRILKLMRNASL